MFSVAKKDNIDITLMINCRSMEQFLGSCSAKTTRRMYKRGISLFIEFYRKDIDTILNERKDDLTPRKGENLIDAKNRASRYENILEKYHGWLLEQKYTINSARTYCLGIMQLFRYYNMTITLRTGSQVSQTVISTKDFILQPEHVRAMFHVAKDLRSKLLVSIGKDLGWRISDVLSIKREELPDLEQPTPIEWIRVTHKEKQVSKTCLSGETVAILKEYLFTFPSENVYLFNSNGDGHINPGTVNRRLKDLAQDADITLGNSKLTWHCFRKMVFSQAKNLGIDNDIIKLMVGKSVKKDVLTYMSGIDVKTAFTKLQQTLGINLVTRPQADSETELKQQIAKLEKAMSSLQSEVQNLKTREETAVKERKRVLVESTTHYLNNTQNLIDLLEIISTKDPQLKELLKEQITTLKRKIKEITNI